jgi:hypothetical protein
VGLVAAVAVTLLAWPTGGRTSVAEPGLSRPAWAEVLAGLDAQRAAAFATGEPEALHRVYAEHTAALRSDVDVLRGYVRRHLRVAGLRHELVSVDVLRETPDRVTLRVVDTIPAFRVLDPDGRVVERLTGRPERAWVLTLVRSGARWQISELASA